MAVKTFNTFDVAKAVMFDGLLGNQAMLRRRTPTFVDMELATLGAYPSRFRRFRDEFQGDTINLDSYLLTADANATVFAIAETHPGRLTGTTGSAGSGDGHSLWMPNITKGDKNPLLMVTMQIDNVTNMKWEMGLVDANGDKTLGAATDIDTPTNSFGDGAVFTIETAETIATMRFLTEGSNSQTIAVTNLFDVHDSAQLASKTGVNWTPTAATDYTFMVAINGDDAYGMIFDSSMNPLYYTEKADGLEGATELSGWIFSANSAMEAKVVLVKDIFYMYDR